jgi:hypothetical protein
MRWLGPSKTLNRQLLHSVWTVLETPAGVRAFATTRVVMGFAAFVGEGRLERVAALALSSAALAPEGESPLRIG